MTSRIISAKNMSVAVIGTLFCACAHGPVAAGPNPTASLVAAERAFAADASARTVNEAFLTVFHDSMTLFRPTPVNGQKALAERAIPATLDLRWGPTYAEVSVDGSLGYTIGPSTFGQRGQHTTGSGWFVSVWKRSGTGWKLRTDGGIDAPIGASLDRAPHDLITMWLKKSYKPQRLLEAEQALIKDFGGQFESMASEDVKVMRDGTAPTQDRDAAVVLIRKDARVTYVPEHWEIAGSGDLGYVYGRIEGDKPHAYERIWRRDWYGRWVVVVDWRN